MELENVNQTTTAKKNNKFPAFLETVDPPYRRNARAFMSSARENWRENQVHLDNKATVDGATRRFTSSWNTIERRAPRRLQIK